MLEPPLVCLGIPWLMDPLASFAFFSRVSFTKLSAFGPFCLYNGWKIRTLMRTKISGELGAAGTFQCWSLKQCHGHQAACSSCFCFCASLLNRQIAYLTGLGFFWAGSLCCACPAALLSMTPPGLQAQKLLMRWRAKLSAAQMVDMIEGSAPRGSLRRSVLTHDSLYKKNCHAMDLTVYGMILSASANRSRFLLCTRYACSVTMLPLRRCFVTRPGAIPSREVL